MHLLRGEGERGGGGGGEDRGLKTFHRLRAVSYFFCVVEIKSMHEGRAARLRGMRVEAPVKKI